MKNKHSVQDVPGIRRLVVAILLILCFLIGIVHVIPWNFPYDRIDCLYGLEMENIPVGHSGGTFEMYCAPMNGSPTAELLINGKPYSEAEYSKERFTVLMGDELFTQPGRLDLTLKLTYAGRVSLRTNTVSVYVVE